MLPLGGSKAPAAALLLTGTTAGLGSPSRLLVGRCLVGLPELSGLAMGGQDATGHSAALPPHSPAPAIRKVARVHCHAMDKR